MTNTLYGFGKSDAKKILDNARRSDDAAKISGGANHYATVLWVKLTEQVTGGTDGLKWKGTVQDFNGTDHTDRAGAFAFDDDTPISIVGGGAAAVDDIVRAEVGGSIDNRAVWVAVVSSSPTASGGSSIAAVNQTLVTTAGSGTWVALDAVDGGTYATLALLIAAHPSPSLNEYSLVTETGTYWVSNGTDWIDSLSGSKAGAELEGSWIAQHTAAVGMQVTCDVGSILFLNKHGSTYYANINFMAWRGVTQA